MMHLRRAAMLPLFGLAAVLAGCATSDGPAGYQYAPYSPGPGTYAWCPPPCMYPPTAWGYQDFSDLHFFYPAVPYYYSPFDVWTGTPWFVYTRPVPPPPPRAPKPPAKPAKPPRDQSR